MAHRLKRILLGVAVGALVVTAGIWMLIHSLGAHEAMFQGKPLDFWVTQLQSHQSAASNAACVVLEQVAIPQLIQIMFNDTNDSKFRVTLVEQLNSLPGVTILFIPADGRRAEAARDLGSLGSGAKAAVPSLVKALKGTDGAVRGPSALALGRIQSQPESIIPLLIGLIDDPQGDVPEAVVEALGDFGPLSKAAVPKIMPLLRAPEKGLRHAANLAIQKIDPHALEQK